MPNIVSEYTWTATTGSYKAECPRIFARTFEPLNSDIYNSLANWVSSIQPNRQYQTYYKDLHTTETRDMWVFPYFNDTARSFTNEWGDQRVDSTSSKVTGLLAQYFEANVGNAVANAAAAAQEIGAIFQRSNSMLLEPPKFYQYGNSDTDVVIEFPLINTINPSEDIKKNWELIDKLIRENRFERLGGAATKSPYLWSIVIPGYRAIRWASCNVDVTFVGNRKYIVNEELGNKIVPEGYRVKLTFKSLYTEPRNFMGDVGGEFLG